MLAGGAGRARGGAVLLVSGTFRSEPRDVVADIVGRDLTTVPRPGRASAGAAGSVLSPSVASGSDFFAVLRGFAPNELAAAEMRVAMSVVSAVSELPVFAAVTDATWLCGAGVSGCAGGERTLPISLMILAFTARRNLETEYCASAAPRLIAVRIFVMSLVANAWATFPAVAAS